MAQTIDMEAIQGLPSREKMVLIGEILGTLVEEVGEHQFSDTQKAQVRKVAEAVRTYRETGEHKAEAAEELRR
jgi:hypothetical protein